MVFSRHPVSAALFMIISLVSVAALFVLLEAFFLAILQVSGLRRCSNGFISVYNNAFGCRS